MAEYDEEFVHTIWQMYHVLGDTLDSWVRSTATYDGDPETMKRLCKLQADLAIRSACSIAEHIFARIDTSERV